LNNKNISLKSQTKKGIRLLGAGLHTTAIKKLLIIFKNHNFSILKTNFLLKW
jgi:hypothetical protein